MVTHRGFPLLQLYYICKRNGIYQYNCDFNLFSNTDLISPFSCIQCPQYVVPCRHSDHIFSSTSAFSEWFFSHINIVGNYTLMTINVYWNKVVREHHDTKISRGKPNFRISKFFMNSVHNRTIKKLNVESEYRHHVHTEPVSRGVKNVIVFPIVKKGDNWCILFERTRVVRLRFAVIHIYFFRISRSVGLIDEDLVDKVYRRLNILSCPIPSSAVVVEFSFSTVP